MTKEEMNKKILCCTTPVIELALGSGKIPCSRFIKLTKRIVKDVEGVVGESIPFTEVETGKKALLSSIGSLNDAIGRLQVVEGCYRESSFNLWVAGVDALLHP